MLTATGTATATSTSISENKVFVTSSTYNESQQLLRLFNNHISGTSRNERRDDVSRLHWKIDNKYYHANVTFILMDMDDILGHEINETDPFIYFLNEKDVEKDTEKSDVVHKSDVEERTKERLTKIASSVRIMVSNISREIQDWEDWCLANGWELVVLTSDESDKNDEDAAEEGMLLKEKHGLDRVLEALEMNEWQSMTMKQGHLSSSIGNGEEEEEANASHPPTSNAVDQTPIESLISSIFASSFSPSDEGQETQEEEEDSLTRLVSKLSALRTMSQTLPDDQRKELAERVALGFVDFLGDLSDAEEEVSQ